jgi:hypothetical protein
MGEVTKGGMECYQKKGGHTNVLRRYNKRSYVGTTDVVYF